MSNSFIKMLSRKLGTPVPEVEAMWDSAQTDAEDQGLVSGTKAYYDFVTNKLRSLLGITTSATIVESALIRIIAAKPAAKKKEVLTAKRSSIFKIPGIWVSKVEDSTAISMLAYDPIKLNLYVAYKSDSSKYYVYSTCSVKEWFDLARSQSKGKVVQELKENLENVGVLTITGNQP
jgi:hypothetical protein